MLRIENLETGYADKQILYGVTMHVSRGEVVALIGPNGAGKSTVLRAICGVIPVWRGEVRFDQVLINGSGPACNVARGITFAPQGNRIFDELTVAENLEVGGIHLSPTRLKSRTEEVLRLFPNLRGRISQVAGRLSGGEQQMLSLGRALISEPKLLLLDEPSLGLAPNLAHMIFTRVRDINLSMGVTILIVEQKVREVLAVSQRVYSLKMGKVAFAGTPQEIDGNSDKLRQLFL